jgi:hypothetical protein
VNSLCVSWAADTDMGSCVHDDVGDGPIPAMTCSDSQLKQNVSVAGFVVGEAGGVLAPISPKACGPGCRSGTTGVTARTERWRFCSACDLRGIRAAPFLGINPLLTFATCKPLFAGALQSIAQLTHCATVVRSRLSVSVRPS